MPDDLRSIGNQMANVMYNLSQRPGDALTPELGAVMDDLRKQWDAAARVAPAAPSAASASQPTEAASPEQRLVGYVVGMAVHFTPMHPGTIEIEPDSTVLILNCRMKDGWRKATGGGPWSVTLPNREEQIAGEIHAT